MENEMKNEMETGRICVSNSFGFLSIILLSSKLQVLVTDL